MTSTTVPESDLIKHPVFWFDDGSVAFRVENHIFKVHRTLLARHSTFFATYDLKVDSISPIIGVNHDIDTVIAIDRSRRVRVKDVEVLLEHFYHDAPLFSEVQFSRIAALLRVSSPHQLDFPSIHTLARERLNLIVPSGFSPLFCPDDPEEALEIATEYRLPLMQKALYYHFVTSPTSHFDAAPPQSPEDPTLLPLAPETDPAGQGNIRQRPLSPADTKLCAQLMERIIDYFTPILFTPATTPHMACTDVFADTWMPLVIQPALEDDGVYKPLETLERIKGTHWAQAGLCSACVKEKGEEWTEEQYKIWNAMDGWLGLATGAVPKI